MGSVFCTVCSSYHSNCGEVQEVMLEIWEIEDFVNQAIDEYTAMANDAEKSGKPAFASYYDGINRGMKLLFDYIESQSE